MVLSPLARQIVALGLALSAVALSLAYPIRGYLQQQAAEQQAVHEHHALESQIADLQAQEAALKDPAYIKSEAKRRLQYVSPGDIVYVVKVPEDDTSLEKVGSLKDARSSEALSPQAGSAIDTSTSDAANDPSANDPAAGDDDATRGSADGALNDDSGTWYSSLWGTLTGDDN